MDQSKHISNDQFLYLGRWVDKKHFCAFVYDKEGNQRLAGSHKDFENLIASGIWFASKPEPDAPKESRRMKHGISNTISK